MVTAVMNVLSFTISQKTGFELAFIFPSEAKTSWYHIDDAWLFKGELLSVQVFHSPFLSLPPPSCLFSYSTAPYPLHVSVLPPDCPVC